MVDISQIFVVLTYGVGGESQMATGTYTGNGTAGTQITVGFAPDVVIVKTSDGSNPPQQMAFIRTSTMTGDVSKKLNNASQNLFANRIQSLDASGFTVGNNADVNADGLDYYWIAFEAGVDGLRVGTYTGNDADNRSIPSVGFQPGYVIVFGEGASATWYRSSPMPAGKSTKFAEVGLSDNFIQALEVDGFQVGSHAQVNADGVTFHYVAWKAVAGKMAVGQYTGNGGATQSIATVGFRPSYVIVKANAAITPVHRPESLVGDWTLHFVGWGKVSDGIQALQTNGFRVGSIAEVNQNTTTYYWMAFGGGLPPPGALHQWALDETSGTLAADSISSSDGTLWSFPLDDSQWSCQNGGSLIFYGGDDYVSLPIESDYDLTDAVTVAAWVNVTSFSVDEQAIVTKGDTAWRLERNASTDSLQFAVDGLTTNTVVQGSVSVNDGNWHHVAGVYDGAQLLLYVDGQLDTAVTATGTMDTNSSAVYFGDNVGTSARYFHGLMDDVYIYDTALDAASVLALAQESLVGWWKLDETSGTTASDSTAYGNDGSLQNMDGSEWTMAKVDYGLDLDGSFDYIETNMASNLATTVTMMAWFKSDDAGTIGDDYVAQRFITQRRSSTDSRLALGINNDKVAVYWHDGTDVVNEGTDTLTTGRYYHAAVTYDTTNVRLYINGVEDANSPFPATIVAGSTDTFLIGAHKPTDRFFDGVLDDVRIYDEALSAAAINAIYESMAPALTLADHDAGQESDAFTQSGSETDAELFGFNLDADGDIIAVTQLVFRLTNISGLTDPDWTFGEIVVDDDNNGTIEFSETTTVGGVETVDQAAGTITFPLSFNVSSATNYILQMDFSDLSDGDAVTIDLDSADITTTYDVAGSTTAVTHSEVTPAAGGSMATGTYTGNGTSQSITGVGFQPDVVIIKGDTGKNAILRSSTMTGDASKQLVGNSGLVSGRILSLDTDGFTVGSNAEVNLGSTAYYWVAFQIAAGQLDVGTYPGNSTDDHNISGVGFQPDYLIVLSAGSHNVLHHSSTMPVDFSVRFSEQNLFTDRIQEFQSDGFQVGTHNQVNMSSTTYHYVAFKESAGQMKVGSYPGDADSEHNITGVGFQPAYLITKAEGFNAAHRMTSVTGDSTLDFKTVANYADGIKELQTDGFQVGTHPKVNQSTKTYYWMAFANESGGGGPPKIVRWREVNPN